MTNPILILITPELYDALKRVVIHSYPGLAPKSEIRAWLLARQAVAKWIDDQVTPAVAAKVGDE